MWTTITRKAPWLATYQAKIWCASALLLVLLVVNTINVLLQRPWWIWLQIPVSALFGYYAGRLIARASAQQAREAVQEARRRAVCLSKGVCKG